MISNGDVERSHEASGPEQRFRVLQAAPSRPEQRVRALQVAPSRPEQRFRALQAAPSRPEQQFRAPQVAPSWPEQRFRALQGAPSRPEQRFRAPQAAPSRPEQRFILGFYEGLAASSALQKLQSPLGGAQAAAPKFRYRCAMLLRPLAPILNYDTQYGFASCGLQAVVGIAAANQRRALSHPNPAGR